MLLKILRRFNQKARFLYEIIDISPVDHKVYDGLCLPWYFVHICCSYLLYQFTPLDLRTWYLCHVLAVLSKRSAGPFWLSCKTSYPGKQAYSISATITSCSNPSDPIFKLNKPFPSSLNGAPSWSFKMFGFVVLVFYAGSTCYKILTKQLSSMSLYLRLALLTPFQSYFWCKPHRLNTLFSVEVCVPTYHTLFLLF